MDDAEPVPIVEVHAGNFNEMWPSLLLAIKSASFVAMDTELSGLGVRSKLNAKNIDDRYAIICELARSHSVISLGLSCFKLQASTPSIGHSNTDNYVQMGDDSIQPDEGCIRPGDATIAGMGKNRQSKYLVQTFNIPLLCTESYVVDPAALKFLIAHNFDFNAQYSRGLPYHRGNDVDEDKKLHAKSMRRLFHELLRNNVPIVFHNALIDLVFVYQCFYCDLPPTLASFLADLSEAFTGGIYDTKYISEFKARWPASYLEYVFRKSERENASSAVEESSHFLLTFPSYEGITKDVTYQRSVQVDSADTDKQEVTDPCRAFSAHGWCSAGEACPKSHDLGVILDSEGKTVEKKRRKRTRHNIKGMTADDVEMSVDTTGNGCVNGNGTCVDGAKSTIRTGSHSAGYDAFMTGFAFAYYVGKYAECRSGSKTASFTDVDCSDMTNKICLTGKDIPLQVVRSSFAKTSKNHRDKLEWLKLANG